MYESGDIDRRLPQIGVIIPCSRLFFIFGLILLLPMKLNQKKTTNFFSKDRQTISLSGKDFFV